MNEIKKIISGHGNTEEMNIASVNAVEKTDKHFKKRERQSGYNPPKYVKPKTIRKDGSSEGSKHSIKIIRTQGCIIDFETWVNDKIRQTKKENDN